MRSNTSNSPEQDNAAFERARQLGHEERDVSNGVAWLGGGFLVLLVIGSLGAMSLLSSWLTNNEQGSPIESYAAPPRGSEVRMQQTRLEQQQQQRAELDRYHWLDRQADVVQIPIERAMGLIVANPSLLEELPGAQQQDAPPPDSPPPAQPTPEPEEENNRE